MIYNYTIRIKKESSVTPSEYNLGTIINGAKTVIKNPICSKVYKSAAAQASFVLTGVRDKVLYSSVLQDILDARSNINPYDIEVTIRDDNAQTVFSGYLDDANFSIISGSLPESLSLTARDKSTILDQKTRLEQYYEGKTRTQLVSLLLGAVSTNSGVTCTLLSSDLTDNGTDSVVSNWVITEDDNKTFRDRIDTLLFEAPACVLWYDSKYNGYRIKQLPTNGVLVADNSKTYHKGDMVAMDSKLYCCNVASVVGVADRTKWSEVREVRYLNADKLTTSNGVYAKDGVLVKYPTVTERANQNVYAENISNSIEEDETTGLNRVVGEEIAKGEFFPVGGDQVKTLQNYTADGLDRAYISKQSSTKNEDLSLLYVKDAQLDIMASSDALVEYPTAIAKTGYPGHTEFYMRKAWILLKNTDEDNAVNLTAMSVSGTAVYKSTMNKMTIPEACTTPEEYETETLFASAGDDKVKEFASWLYNSKKYSCTTSSWTEIEGSFGDGANQLPFSILGDIVRVAHRVSDSQSISIPHVVIQIDDEAFTTYGRVRKQKVTAISLNGYSVYSNAKKEVSCGSASTSTQSMILSAKTFYGLSASTSAEPEAWTDNRASLQPSNTNKYVWQYVVYTYTSGATKQTEKQIVEVYKDVDVKSISIISSASAITKNNRETGSKDYTFTAKVQGYETSKLRWFMDGVAIENTDEATEISVSIDYKDATAHTFTVRIDGDDTAYDSVTLSVVDVTEAPKYRGKAGTSAELAVIEADVIDGDGFLAVADFGGYYAEGIPYIYRDELNKDGKHWFAQAEINGDNSSMFMAILQDASSITNLNSDAFTWIGRLLANEAVIDSLFANTIQIQKSIYSGSYNKDGQTSSDSKGFYADKDGTLKATEATFKNANISEMTASDVNIVRGKISGMTSVEANVGRFDSVKGSLDLDALKTYEDATGITFNDSAPRDILQVSDIMSVMPDYSLKTPTLQTGNITYRGATYTEYACQRMSAEQLHRGTAVKKYTTNGWNGYDGFNDWAYPFAIGSNGASGGSNVFVSVKDIIRQYLPDLWTEIDNAGHWDQLFYVQLRGSSGQSFYVYANGSSSYSYKSSPSDSIIFRGWMRATDTLKVYIKDSAISGYRDHYLRVSVNYDTSDTAKGLLPKLLNTPGIYNTGNTATAPVGARKMRIVWMRGYGSVYVNGVSQGSYGSKSTDEDGGVTINYDYARNLELTVSAGSTIEITGDFTFLQYWFYSSLDSGIILRNSTSAVWLESTEHIIRSTISTSLFEIPNATRVSIDSLRSLLINSSVPQDAELYLDSTTVNQIVLDGVAIDITRFKITETGISYMVSGIWYSLGLFDDSGEDYSTLSAILTVLAEKGRLETKSLEPKTQDCDIGLENNRYNHIYAKQVYANSLVPAMTGDGNTKTGTATIKETYTNGTSGYRIWTDGYCEQWGRASVVYSSGSYVTSASFIKTFADTNYCIAYSTYGIQSDTYASNVNSFSTTGFSIRNRGGGSFNFWRAMGYLAEGQY